MLDLVKYGRVKGSNAFWPIRRYAAAGGCLEQIARCEIKFARTPFVHCSYSPIDAFHNVPASAVIRFVIGSNHQRRATLTDRNQETPLRKSRSGWNPSCCNLGENLPRSPILQSFRTTQSRGCYCCAGPSNADLGICSAC